MLPPYATQSEDARVMARHTSVGIEPRVSSERFILLDTQVRFCSFFLLINHLLLVNECRCVTKFPLFSHKQPVFSPSVLAEMMRPDGSSTIPVLSGETLSAELAHEIMNIQVTKTLNINNFSVCFLRVIVAVNMFMIMSHCCC